MAWKRGPLPPETWGWGGAVPAGDNPVSGFYFADFKGDHVTLVGGGPDGADRDLKPYEVAWYDNSLTLPPLEGVKGRVGAAP